MKVKASGEILTFFKWWSAIINFRDKFIHNHIYGQNYSVIVLFGTIFCEHLVVNQNVGLLCKIHWHGYAGACIN